jgi:hypothetical protein
VTTNRMSPVSQYLRHLRRSVVVRDRAGMSDRQLLNCYVSTHDEAAFEALVRRHGPMVLGVCRRVLRDPHEADDAFQATFLVLICKAAGVVPGEMLPNWLYGVAHQTAVRAKSAASKRRLRERQVPQMPEPRASQLDSRDDLRPLLDEELARLRTSTGWRSFCATWRARLTRMRPCTWAGPRGRWPAGCPGAEGCWRTDSRGGG